MKHLGYIIACFIVLLNVQLVKAQGDVNIGTQVWTSKNLDVNTFRNGEAIPEAKNAEEWVKAGENKQPAWCYYDNNVQNGKNYGKLYNWYAVNDSRGLAPKGYHIPSDAEWTVLTDFLGGEFKAGDKMKSKTGWQKNGKKSGNLNNSSGFNGLPGGLFDDNGDFIFITVYGNFWSSSEGNTNDAWFRYLSSNDAEVSRFNASKENGLSVRCIREYGDIKYGSNSNHVSKVENISDKVNNTVLQNHSTVTIGNQVWTTKNLDVSTFRNGEAIPEAKNAKEWAKAGENKTAAYCYHDYDSKNGKVYGKLYNWYAVNDSRGLAPNGYHIPSDAEWKILTVILGGENPITEGGVVISVEKAGEKMKSKQGWKKKGGNGEYGESGGGNNSSGFNGLPGGLCHSIGVFNDYMTVIGNFWSSTERNTDGAWYRFLYYYNTLLHISSESKNSGFSVRCIRDYGDIKSGYTSDYVYKVDNISEKINNTILQNYSTVTIGNQVWTTKNLEVSTFRNGEAIPEAKNAKEWEKAAYNESAAFCYYDYDSKNGKVYGKLYNWFAVNDSRGLAPKGYHIPSHAEWTILTDMLGGEDVAGKKMKSTTGWSNSGSGNNSSGLNGLPGGYCDLHGYFKYVSEVGLFWSSSDAGTNYAWHRTLFSGNAIVGTANDIQHEGFSVRCLRD